MRKATNNHAPEAHERAARLVLDHEPECGFLSAAVSISEKIGCAA